MNLVTIGYQSRQEKALKKVSQLRPISTSEIIWGHAAWLMSHARQKNVNDHMGEIIIWYGAYDAAYRMNHMIWKIDIGYESLFTWEIH